MANQPNSLGYNVEQWVIDILRAGGVIPEGFAVEHYDETERADSSRIVVQAVVGDRDLGGCAPWNVAVTIDQITLANVSMATAESYVAAIEDAMEDPETVASLAAFSHLELLAAEDEQKEASGNARRRTRTYNLLALEESGAGVAPSNVFAPVITSSGDLESPIVGDVLTVTPGEWTGEPTPAITYQWRHQSDFANIGATGAEYTVQESDIGERLYVAEIATNTAGSAFTDSNISGEVASAPVEFDPADYGAVVAWYSDTGSDAAIWPDLSGSGNDATQATMSKQPAIVPGALSGRQGRLFDGVDDWMGGSTNLLSAGAPRYIFAVGEATSDGGALFTARLSPLVFQAALNNYSGTFFAFTDGANSANNATISDARTTIQSPFLSTHASSGAEAKIELWLNGSTIAVSQSGSVPAENGATGFALGNNGLAGLPSWAGKLFEIVICSAVSDRAGMEAALMAKWGITP